MGKQTVVLTLSLALLLLAGCKQEQIKAQQNKPPQPSAAERRSQPAAQSTAGQQQQSQPSATENSGSAAPAGRDTATNRQQTASTAAASPSPEGSPAEAATPGTAPAGSPADSDTRAASGSGTMTRAERIAALEEELEGSMATYDGMILRERDYALSRANQRGSEEELEADGDGGLPYDEGDLGASGGKDVPAAPGKAGEATAAQSDSTAGGGSRPASPGSPSDENSGEHTPEGTYPPPADLPDGSDDDVVARQIREAALNEPDPQLREKLWEEYRKYKNQ